ncbi:hypothetical protein H2248_005290 [Termitomyces sp. 'cryptogamus']|nr:hypothetical protein H2248_005290 [Termitomyces sp. 'cryptogamus']
MAFVLSRSSSPNPQDPQRESHSVPLDSTCVAPYPSSCDQHDMTIKDKDLKPRIEILLDSPKGCIFLKGVGVDVEPTLLSGHVAIYLSEATSIKEITLQFRGKARLSVPPSEMMTFNSAPLTYIICNHDWSFLEGEKNTSHTLKAGRHLFPFQLRLGGSLPSTISSPAFEGADISYKLHAQVIRSGLFNHSYHADIPVHIIRSFAPEAMEYQQTLEIENTWPEKLMYSIMLPHKAWAAGDKLTALVKFSPLTKGVCVLSVHTSIHEQSKIYARSGAQEQTRRVASVKHEIINGRAIEVEDHRIGQPRSPKYPSTPESLASPSGYGSGTFDRSCSSSSLSSLGRSYSSHSALHGFTSTSSSASSEIPPVVPSNAVEELSLSETDSQDVVTYLSIYVPLSITPTHSLEPIVVSHRIRWNILIMNLDGHTSELRCSLPLHLLDFRLLNESRNLSAATRRLLVGCTEVPPIEEEDVQLPSYHQHVRDRVANMFLPESATMRVTNPWIAQGANPIPHIDAPMTPWPLTESGYSTPLEARLLTNLPHQPDLSTSNGPLEWVNSELLLSLSQNPPPRLRADSPHREREPRVSSSSSTPQSRSHSRSRPSSRVITRLSSRHHSPERGRDHHQHHRPSTSETYMHNQTRASRNTDSVFSATMKPLTSFSPSFLSRSASTQHLPTAEEVEAAQRSTFPSVRMLTTSTGTELLHRAFTEVPDYTVASRGFIGGVPPLTSMQGLPSYDESVRSSPRNSGSETDLTGTFGEMSIEDSEGGGGEGRSISSPLSTRSRVASTH